MQQLIGNNVQKKKLPKINNKEQVPNVELMVINISLIITFVSTFIITFVFTTLCLPLVFLLEFYFISYMMSTNCFYRVQGMREEVKCRYASKKVVCLFFCLFLIFISFIFLNLSSYLKLASNLLTRLMVTGSPVTRLLLTLKPPQEQNQ